MLNVITGELAKNYKGIMFPENGKTPMEVFEYAKQITQESKNKDITIITYNPILIESIDSWSTWFEVEAHFFLNEENYTDSLGEIYDYLGKPFDEINILELRIHRGQRASNYNCRNNTCGI